MCNTAARTEVGVAVVARRALTPVAIFKNNFRELLAGLCNREMDEV